MNEQQTTVTEIGLEQIDESIEDQHDPSLPATELVRLSDIVRSDDKFRSLKETRYTPKFREMLQRPAFAAYRTGDCPEYFESVKAAYAACYYLSEDALKQDIVEQATAESWRLYGPRFEGDQIWGRCEHDLIRATCVRCESTKSPKFELPFSIDGLKKLTVRICERLKKQANKRVYLKHFQSDGVGTSLTDEDVSDGGRTEDNLIAAIDAERCCIDTGNVFLMRSLAKIFSKSELKRFLDPTSCRVDLVHRFRKYFFETSLKA